MSVHPTPVPAKPARHAHWNEPAVSVQDAFGWQLCVASTHSFRFVQLAPSAASAKPSRQLQVNDPAGALVHVCAQLLVPVRHSSRSTHVTPLPV
jgi:hypothetical protein